MPRLAFIALAMMFASVPSVSLAQTTVQSLQLSATAHIYVGTHEEAGTADITVNADGSSNLILNMESGTQTETLSGGSPTSPCSSSGKDQVVHVSLMENCLRTISWLVPTLALQATQASTITVTDLGLLDFHGQMARKLTVQPASLPGHFTPQATAQIIRHSSVGVYIDESSHLPLGISYTLLTDPPGIRQLAVEVRYSAYRQFGTITIPTHIERRYNGSLQLSLDIVQANILN